MGSGKDTAVKLNTKEALFGLFPNHLKSGMNDFMQGCVVFIFKIQEGGLWFHPNRNAVGK